MPGHVFSEWGLLTSIDLFKCNPKTIRDKAKIAAYAEKLCKMLKFKRFGKTEVVHFGSSEKVEGYSMVQFIESSLVSGHFANSSNNAYIDIFSCGDYDSKKAINFTKKFFWAKSAVSNVLPRKMGASVGEADRIFEIPNSWVFESYGLEEGRTTGIKISKALATEKSQFQRIAVFETPAFGRMMTIDGIVQFTESDEFAYHEMMAHPAINVKPEVERVLIIGGGDGGVAREVLKYRLVKRLDLCDIDKKVTELSKRFFPSVSVAFKDKRLHLFHMDGFRFLGKKKNEYDLIIVDSTDPIGFAKSLFKKDFFKKASAALKGDGILVSQMESVYYDRKFIAETLSKIRRFFPLVRYYYTLIPTYPSGTIGFAFASKKYCPLKDYSPKKPSKPLKYYNAGIHKACFALPEFAKKAFSEK
ncbi:MAG: polyamine aminopropyltransferase [Candidatus Diapherotrites archaeon]